MAIKFANRMGFRTMVIGGGKDKGDMVKRLGGCIALTATCRTQLRNLSGREGGGGRGCVGAKVILATVPGGKAMNLAQKPSCRR